MLEDSESTYSCRLLTLTNSTSQKQKKYKTGSNRFLDSTKSLISRSHFKSFHFESFSYVGVLLLLFGHEYLVPCGSDQVFHLLTFGEQPPKYFVAEILLLDTTLNKFQASACMKNFNM